MFFPMFIIQGEKMNNLKIGLLGYGYIGRIHSLAYKSIPVIFPELELEYELKYLIRRRKSITEKNFWKERSHKIEELKNVTLADICTPNFLHYSQIEKIINYGVNVYAEKPLGINYKESLKLAQMIDGNNLINQVAFVYRFLPAVAKARALLMEKKIGEIINFRAQILHASYLDPERPINWRLEKKLSGGGALLDLGIHIVDTIRFLLGEAKELRAETKTVFSQRPIKGKQEHEKVDVDDWALVNLEMKNGVTGTIEVSKVSLSDSSFLIEIYGTKGSLKISDKDPLKPHYLKYEKNNNLIEKTKEKVKDDFSSYLANIYPSPKKSMGMMIDLHLASQLNLLSNLQKKEIVYKETPTFTEAAKSHKIIEKAYLSAKKEGEKIKI